MGDVVDRAGPVGLAARHTSSPSVGVAGSSLGGGLSWYARHAGLQCSALTAVEIVLADGSFVRATDAQDSELLWAARGGGGGFGVVTALEFDLLPVTRVYGGMLAWDWIHAQRVLGAWAEWAAGAPEEVTSVAVCSRPPRRVAADRHPGPPPRRARLRRGRRPRAGRAVLAPLRALRPELDTGGELPAASVARLHLDPEAPTAVYANSVLLADLPERAVEALVAAAGPGSGSELLFVELRQLGGALSRPAPRGGALDSMVGSFLALGVGTETGAGWASVRENAARVMDALQPWSTGSTYLLMADAAVDERRGWPDASWRRLAALRGAADPHGLFVPPPLGRRARLTAAGRVRAQVGVKGLSSARAHRGGRQHTTPGGTMTLVDTRPAPHSYDAPFAELDARTSGTVAVPGDEAYDALVSPWNLAIPVRPTAVLAAGPPRTSSRRSASPVPTACASPRRPPATAPSPTWSASCSSPPRTSTSASSTPRAGPASGPA